MLSGLSGLSGLSAVAGGVAPPPAPTLLSAVASTFYGSIVTGTTNTVPAGQTYYLDRSPDNVTWTAAGTIAAGNSSLSITGLTPQTAYYVRARAKDNVTGLFSGYRYLGGGASPGTQVTTAWEPSLLGSTLKGCWLHLNNANGNFVFSSADNSVPCSPGDSIRFDPGVFGTTNNLSQATSGNRPTAQTDGAQFDTTSDSLGMSSAIALTGDFTVYSVGVRAAGNPKYWALGRSASTFTCLTFYTDGNAYFTVDSGSNVSVAAAVSGSFVSRFRRASNSVFANWTGRGSEASLGTLSGTATFDVVGTRFGEFNGSTANRFVFTAACDSSLSSGNRTLFETWITNNFGVSL